MSIEIIGLICGFVFKFIGVQQKATADALQASILRFNRAESSIQAAREFQKADASGKWVRRFLIISACAGIIYFPAILPFFNIPIVTEVSSTIKGFLWGVFPDKVIVDFVPVYGFLMTPEIKEAFKIIIFFYFGQAAAK